MLRLLVSRYDLSRAEVEELLAGEAPLRARQLWRAMYAELGDPAQATALPRTLRDRIAASSEFAPALGELAERHDDAGSTVKWLWRLHDGAVIETVLMLYERRATVCVSSQAGCAMGCSFCATGQAGFRRQLSRGEIVEQVVRAASYAKTRASRRLSNVVFMGMGEPLANFAATSSAAATITSELGISARSVTISTVGIVPGMKRLAQEAKPYTLAISLHSTDEATRTRLIPQNRIYGIEAIVAAAENWSALTGRRVSLEWACMRGVNDSAGETAGLIRLARRLGAHVNLIPLNPTPGWPAQGSTRAEVAALAARLREAGVAVSVRDNRGTAIAAACGQLAGEQVMRLDLARTATAVQA